MQIGDTFRYQCAGENSDEEWSKLVPDWGHSLRVDFDGDYTGPYSVAMFHQLGCLDVIRQDYNTQDGPSALSLHCLNYLRQSILCLADTRVEPVTSWKGPGIVNVFSDYVCRDWEAVYSIA
ncbi:hypothetical protein PUNSTDRAFT_76701 [Punctularia strigosozonata HHB-11173 SS5]|uniref:Uncharacterized protein n=1 Tax=Punctularia strigosozonata (strain HHB-11173) TaxID=741275 RepID=R7S2Q3_PUNST|nr:uncharacterized protein PUNSTDRAFT_76701 [Punctularia strigosozonata HHB-11173 SS5]EIN04129.1 hypothetical protein PUNSTDRAFT_76701 [Punctularia strigosozonata HHB-11173 SS5]